jgi:hypothetical protein
VNIQKKIFPGRKDGGENKTDTNRGEEKSTVQDEGIAGQPGELVVPQHRQPKRIQKNLSSIGQIEQ